MKKERVKKEKKNAEKPALIREKDKKQIRSQYRCRKEKKQGVEGK